MEQALGHVTYTKNLQTAYAVSDRLRPRWMLVPYQRGDLLERVPGIGSNWTMRGSLRGYAAVAGHGGARRFDAVVFHTQTVGLLAPLVARRVPVIISLDATPLNFDEVGIHYGHQTNPGSRAELVKRALYRRAFRGAAALTTWSQWAKDSLRDDYGVDPENVTVVAPGVDLSLFPFGTERDVDTAGRPVRILFVGGDFERKGGLLLLECMRAGLAARCELHIVTKQPVPETPGVHVYSDLGPNDPRLVELYRQADIFALPTYADCMAVVLGEAMAAGLPVVTTSVGAQPEAVHDGHSGMIVPPGDVAAVGRALQRLVDDPALRRSMGREGRVIAEARYDARTNADRLVDVILAGIARGRRGVSTRAVSLPGRQAVD